VAHSLSRFDADTLLLEYRGLVGYAERSQAVTVAADWAACHGVKYVLIDFTRAVAIEEGAAQRADFLAKAITAWNVRGVRVAFVGIARHYALPAELACEIRHNPARVFRTRDQAFAWFARSGVESPMQHGDDVQVAPI
jgi:hypothetical protein